MWVDLSSHQYAENGLLAGLGWGFHPKITLLSTRKTPLIYVKRAKDKNIAKLFIGVPWVRNGQCKQFQARLYPLPVTPQGVTKWDFIYVKTAKAKTVSYRTLGFPEYGMANASNFMRGFTPASNPKRLGNIWATKLAFNYVKRAKAKNSVISCLRVPIVRNGQCKQFHARLYPYQQPQRG